MNGDSTDAPPAPEQNVGDDRENEEVGEEEEKGRDLKKQEGGEEEGLRPKLAEGFYEIEAVRRKRVRKGQVQYFIKWRGWPETANTWEPYENLASCYDVIEAFEESLRSGKRRSRKRKRRSTGPVPQAKKKLQGNAASTSRAPDAGDVKFDEGNFVIPSLDDQNHEDGGRPRIGDINSNEVMEKGNENGSVVVPPQVEEKENHYEMDANRGELTNAPFPSEGSNRLPVDILESEASEVICFANGNQKVDGEGVVKASGFQNGHQKVDSGVVIASGFENGHQMDDGEGVVQAGGLENGHQVVDGEGVVQAGGLENGHQVVDGEGVVQAGGLENGHQMVDREGVVQAGGLDNGHQVVDGERVVQAGGLENGHQMVDREGVVQAGGLDNEHQMVDGEGVVQAGGLDNEHQMVDGEGVVQGDSFENGHQNVDGEGVMQAGGRLGNRKRKPSLVKRFNQEQAPCVTNYAAQDLTTKNTRSGGIVAQNRDQNSVYRSNDPESKTDDITDGSAITEIMKPISFASSESAPGILVTFMAKRSDGKEVMVDNTYLKANNPLLLINYYEQHLNYNATTGPPRPGGDSML